MQGRSLVKQRAPRLCIVVRSGFGESREREGSSLEKRGCRSTCKEPKWLESHDSLMRLASKLNFIAIVDPPCDKERMRCLCLTKSRGPTRGMSKPNQVEAVRVTGNNLCDKISILTSLGIARHLYQGGIRL